MSTKTEPKISTLINNLAAAGVPREQAVAVGMSIAHSLQTQSYAEQYGTFLRNALEDFLVEVGA